MATADELLARVEAGSRWLAEHDPKGIFYLWHSSGISPRGRLPALTKPEHQGYIEGRAERYAEWVGQYLIWNRLYDALDEASKREGRG